MMQRLFLRLYIEIGSMRRVGYGLLTKGKFDWRKYVAWHLMKLVMDKMNCLNVLYSKESQRPFNDRYMILFHTRNRFYVNFFAVEHSLLS